MTTWAPSKRARSERIEAEADGADPRSRRSGLSGGAPKGARGQFRCDRRGLGARRQGDCAQDRQPRRPQSINSTGDEHLLRAGSRAGRGAQGSTPSGAEPEPETPAEGAPASPRRSRSAFSSWAREPIPRPSVLREDEIRASDVSAAIIAAAIAAWPPHTIALAHSRSRRSRGFRPAESRRPIRA